MQLTSQVKKYMRARLSREQIRALRNLHTFGFRTLRGFIWGLLFGRNLNMLATIYKTDKWNHHWYTQHYQRHFASIRNRRINLLEIGIGGNEDPERGGASLRMWRTYFPRARIHGLDIYDKRLHEERRIRTFQGSQIDLPFLDEVVAEIGALDIIIDDGSHINEHVLTTFRHLFPKLAPGGIYAVEDTQTSYWPGHYGGSCADRSRTDTTMGFFKSIVDSVNFEDLQKIAPDSTYLDEHICAIHFYHNLVIVQKRIRND